MTDPPTEEYDGVTSDHQAIREFVEDWGATPAVTVDRPGRQRPALVLDDPDEDTETVGFEEFFTCPDANDLALAYRTGDDAAGEPLDYAFVPAQDDDEDLPADAADRPADRAVDKHDEGVADRRSEVREREAEKQENPDNHRDRNPFQG